MTQSPRSTTTPRRPRFWRASVAGLLVLLAACAAPSGSDRGSRALDAGEYAEAIRILSLQVAADPEDWQASRDLGVAFLQTRNPPGALQRLESARALAPEDPATLFYLGACYEKLDRPDDALRAYQAYVGVGADSGFRKKVETRLRYLAREQAVRDARRLAAREDSLDTAPAADPRTVAVTHFGVVGAGDDLAPLGAALSEWLVSDLAKIQSTGLVVVERMRLDALLRELEFSQSAFVDPDSAPRVGRLLSVHRIVSGSLIQSEADRIRADLQLTTAATGETGDGGTAAGSIDAFVALEKSLVFELLDALGIVPTEYERAQIQEAPTRDLRAVLAYGRGVLYERQGLLSEAKTSYQEALGFDAGYGLAVAASDAVVLDPPGVDALLDEAGLEFRGGAEGPGDLGGLDTRLEDTGNLVGGDFWPGRPNDTRPYPFPLGIPEPPDPPRGDQ